MAKREHRIPPSLWFAAGAELDILEERSRCVQGLTEIVGQRWIVGLQQFDERRRRRIALRNFLGALGQRWRDKVVMLQRAKEVPPQRRERIRSLGVVIAPREE